MEIAVLCKGSFRDIEAVARSVGSNAWEIEIEVTALVRKRTRRGPKAEDWDGAVFLLDGAESEPAVGSGERGGKVQVTAFVLE